MRKKLLTKGSQEILSLKYFYYVDQAIYMLRVTYGRTIYKPHSNVGPVNGASGSPADARLPKILRIFREIGGPPNGSKRGVLGLGDGSLPDGRTPTKVRIV